MAPRLTSAASITLAWDASPDPGVSAYKVYYGPITRTYTNTVSAGSALTVTISNLIDGGTYFLAATAVDTNGLESDFSTEVSTSLVSTNQPPTLNPLSNVTLNENATQQTVSLSGIGSGSPTEIQTLSITASSSNPSVIPTPSVTYTSPNANGSISFTPVPFASGNATITVTVNDGSASNNVISRTFTVTVNPVNQPPTLNALSNVTINENASQQNVSLSGISSGATNESQTLTVTASSSNTGLIPNPTVTYTSPNATGSIAFTPVPLAFGSATLTVTVNDGGGSNNVVSRTFTVTVSPVNQAPTLNALSNVTISENAGQQTVSLSGISSGATNESQTLTVTASSSNTGLIPNPTVTYTSPNATGSIAFTPAPLSFGNSTITVTVNDGGTSNNVVSRTFTVTVNPVNQAPTLNALADVTVNQNAGAQSVALSGISSGATNESQTLTVTASSSNTSLVPTPTVTYTSPNATGSINFTPNSTGHGTATITVTVNDGGASNNVVSRTLAVTVNALPTISSITNRAIAVNTNTPSIPFTVGDAESSASSLTVNAASDNTTLVPTSSILLGGTGANRSIAITPASDQTGVANITLTVSDGTGSSSTSFQLNVRQRPAAPTNLRVVAQTP